MTQLLKYQNQLEKLVRIGIKIVGFRVGVDRAVYYKKLETPSDKEFGIAMNVAFHDKHCDFVSVRKVDPKEAAK